MKKILITLSIIILLPVVMIAGAIGFLKFADLNNYKSDIEKLALKYANIKVEIQGDIDVAVSLKPTISLNNVYVYQPEENIKIADVGNALVQFAVIPLLHGEISVEKVQTDNTKIFYNDKDSVLINDLDLYADDYASPININFDTTVSGIDIFGNATIDSFKELKANNYNKTNIVAGIEVMGYNFNYDGALDGLQDKIQTAGVYEIFYKKSKVSGDIDFSMEKEVPYLNINVNSDNININDFTAQKQASNWFISNAYAEEYIPNTQIPYDYLRMVNADITIDVKQIKVDDKIVINNVKGDVSLKNGVMKSNIKNVEFKNNVINGNLEITSPKDLPYIKLNIKGDGFDINDFSGQKKNNRQSLINFDWLISSAYADEFMNNYKIPYKYLKIVNADINADLKKISVGKDILFSNIKAAANLKNSVLKGNISNINAGGGKIKGSFLVNGNNKTLALYLNGTDIIIQNLYRPFSESDNRKIYVKQGGKTIFNIDITTSGISTDDYLSNISGQIITFVDDSVINIKSLNKLQGNILAQILDILKIKSAGDMNLACAVVRGDIDKGVIKFPKGIAFNADTFYLVADGKINLNNNKINLDLQPFSGKISDVNISSILGNLIKITGTINNPKIGINQTSAAKNILGGFASGGAYNVGELMFSADSSPCHTALQGTAYSDYFRKDKSIMGGISSGYNSTKDTINNLGKDIKNQAKGLKKSTKEIKNQIKGLFN